MVVGIILVMVFLIVLFLCTCLYNYKKDKDRLSLFRYVAKQTGRSEVKKNGELHYLLKSEYENCMNSLDLVMLLPDSLVSVKDKIMMALTLSSDESVRTLASRFFDLSDELRVTMNTGLVNDFSDAESMLDLLREKFMEMLIGRCSIEEIIDALNKTNDNITMLHEIAEKRADGNSRCFKKVSLESWNTILDNALTGEISGSSNVTELMSMATKAKIS
ncbi:MAG: hypothetical protein Q4B87_02450 [Candidatus Saccharibacteria bacterium]|nr:hypothetical protein [Candidatus Saccharibacteria bacterium]